jgi:SAM-dependent methyltransferase
VRRSAEHMRRFWDRRAREDAFFFVDSELAYGDPDVARFWEEGERVVDELLGRLGVALRGDERVVDVGCGIGRLTRALAARAAHVDAFDVSPEMVARAREHNAHVENVTWHAGDGTTLRPLPDASVDAVVSHVVFQHVPDPAITYGYVAEMGRVLRPGGWAAFQVSDDPGLHEGRHRPPSRLRALLGRAPRGQRDPAWRGSAVDLARLRAEASAAGLATERVEGAGTQFCLVLLRRDDGCGNPHLADA